MGPDGGMPAGERAEAETAEAAARREFAYAGVCRSSCRERIETHMAEEG